MTNKEIVCNYVDVYCKRLDSGDNNVSIFDCYEIIGMIGTSYVFGVISADERVQLLSRLFASMERGGVTK